MPKVTVKGAIWTHSCKKKGYGRSYGLYDKHRGDRKYLLKPVNGGRTHVYDSPQDAKADGWRKA